MDVVARGKQVVDLLERSYREAERTSSRPERVSGRVPEPTEVDAQAAQSALAGLAELGALPSPVAGWEDWLRVAWFPYLRQFPGADRQIGKGWEVKERLARFALDGDLVVCS